ncbi:hypothetical protein [Staphylococcus petrasii]
MAKVKRNSYKINKRRFSREISLEKRLSIFATKNHFKAILSTKLPLK